MRGSKIALIVVGAFLVLVGLGLLIPGSFLLWAWNTQRDADGFFHTSAQTLSSQGYALVTPDVNLEGVGGLPRGAAAALRIQAESTTGKAVFIGIGPTTQVQQYMANVAHDEVTNFDFGIAGNVRYQHVGGGAPSSLPNQENFWVAQREGPGSQTLRWDVTSGNWTAVIMNADATGPVAVSLSLGARFGLILWIGLGLTIAGVILFALGLTLILLGVRPSRPQPFVYPPGQPPFPTAYPPYPPAPPYHPPGPTPPPVPGQAPPPPAGWPPEQPPQSSGSQPPPDWGPPPGQPAPPPDR